MDASGNAIGAGLGIHEADHMRLMFVNPSDKACDWALIKALKAGNDEPVDVLQDIGYGYDFACVIGIKNAELIRELERRKQPYLYFDKGYNRKWNVEQPEWWRVAVNSHQPTAALSRMFFSHERATVQGWRALPWRLNGPGRIIFAGSSAKYHEFYGLDEPNAYARSIIEQIRSVTPDRTVVYRPKPSWRGAEPVDGAIFQNRARHGISEDLKGAHALVTHGSAACVEALLLGVPSIILGDAVAASISSTSIDDVENPRLASIDECDQLLANLAHCQWSLDEISCGDMWPSLYTMIEAMHAV